MKNLKKRLEDMGYIVEEGEESFLYGLGKERGKLVMLDQDRFQLSLLYRRGERGLINESNYLNPLFLEGVRGEEALVKLLIENLKVENHPYVYAMVSGVVVVDGVPANTKIDLEIG